MHDELTRRALVEIVTLEPGFAPVHEDAPNAHASLGQDAIPVAIRQLERALLEPGTFDRRADGLGDRLGGYADVLELELRNRHTAKQATLIAARPALAAWLDRVDAATRPG